MRKQLEKLMKGERSAVAYWKVELGRLGRRGTRLIKNISAKINGQVFYISHCWLERGELLHGAIGASRTIKADIIRYSKIMEDGFYGEDYKLRLLL